MTHWPGCSVCGSHSVRMVATPNRGTLYLCNHHRAVCWPHLCDPCPVCDADGNTCDGCGKDYPHALTTWQGHAGQGEYCAACLPVAREGNPLAVAKGAA